MLAARLDAPYVPLAQARWETLPRYGSDLAKEAWESEALAFFRWFAAYPVAFRVDVGNPEHCVWFQDLRFLTPGRDATPFRYGMCRTGRGAWKPRCESTG